MGCWKAQLGERADGDHRNDGSGLVLDAIRPWLCQNLLQTPATKAMTPGCMHPVHHIVPMHVKHSAIRARILPAHAVEEVALVVADPGSLGQLIYVITGQRAAGACNAIGWELASTYRQAAESSLLVRLQSSRQ